MKLIRKNEPSDSMDLHLNAVSGQCDLPERIGQSTFVSDRGAA